MSMTTVTTPPTAAAQFFNIPELVAFVAEYAFYPHQYGIIPTLASLRLVNWICYTAATPYCYQELRISASIAYTRSRWRLNPRLDLVKRAFFSFYDGVRKEEEALGAMMSQMSRLESFVYNGHPLTPALLQTLKESCQSLKVLHMNYKRRIGPSPSLGLNFDGFRDLRELMLYNLPFCAHFLSVPDHEWWIPRLARLLTGSPNLQKLSLGFEEAITAHRQAETMHIFDKLCHLYHAAGGSPLPLQSLELLGGLYPCNLTTLQQLINLTHLHDVYIADPARRDPTTPPGSSSSEPQPWRRIAYEAFTPPHAPNLRHLRTDGYSRDLHTHLASLADPAFTQRLAIACKHRYAGTGLDTSALLRPSPHYPSLPLQVRMLDLELFRERIYGSEREVAVSAAQVLSDLVATNGATLEGLAVNLFGGLAQERGTSLAEERLGLLEQALGGLPRLEQLSIGTPWRCDAVFAVAERLAAAAGPRLRYLSIGNSFMRVRRKGGAGGGGVLVMERIAPLEADEVELWKYSLINLTDITKVYTE
ncbi:uncharacterized protein B0H64DRAFT_433676 [Chaetomium fimeti]|uniref:F-box domain-containing protein n=1 Tax=Chaetomium fimeti TaxID=1854472 RepID=A0AAE0HDN1_9PEZI|nr:hypothetical protein B0H64DRAFT_433676 [Chaetomium fimeti]